MAASKPMRLRVRSSTGSTCVVTFDDAAEATVGALQVSVEAQLGLPVARQILLVGYPRPAPLHVSSRSRLCEHGVSSGDTVQVMTAAEGEWATTHGVIDGAQIKASGHQARVAFLLGCHAVVGCDSAVFRSFRGHVLFDAKLLALVFDAAGELPTFEECEGELEQLVPMRFDQTGRGFLSPSAVVENRRRATELHETIATLLGFSQGPGELVSPMASTHRHRCMGRSLYLLAAALWAPGRQSSEVQTALRDAWLRYGYVPALFAEVHMFARDRYMISEIPDTEVPFYESAGPALAALAEAGDKDAMYWLGYSLWIGQQTVTMQNRRTFEFGIAPDPKLSFKWYSAAAETGLVPAVAAVARCYKHGTGTGKSHVAAKRHMRRAADAGHLGSINSMLHM